ncbi:16S rRNA processing protein RimM [Propioniferax innocua]|uniref:Ribosome maturation factor RimM n=2 Tax=Propioniferax innocua TaxID=1753 RepID=A0A542ZPW1_9ACTN|nr:16S rRNA processing protein RimM [Propioniferax innocua]
MWTAAVRVGVADASWLTEILADRARQPGRPGPLTGSGRSSVEEYVMGSIRIVVGRIGRPHGVRGELTVEPRTDEPEVRFAQGAELHADRPDGDGGEERAWRVAGSRWHSGRLLIRLEGVDDRNAAEALRGTVVAAEVDADAEPAAEDEFYDRHLIGLEVRVDGKVLGKVVSVVHGAQDLLEVRTESGRRLVPFVEALVPVVDVAAGYCEVVDLPGLLRGEPDE